MPLTTNSYLRIQFAIIFTILTFTLPAQYYWVGDGGSWDDFQNHWATTSGGTSFHTQAPTQDDDVIFDENSFSLTGQLVNIETDNSNCKSMKWENVTNNPGLESSGILNIFGSLTLSPDMTCSLRFIELESPNTGNTINTFGTSLGSNAILRVFDKGTWDLESVLDLNSIQMLEGTFNSNGNTINLGFTFLIDHATEKIVDLSGSIINSQQWRLRGSNLELEMDGSVLNTNSFYGDSDENGPYNYNTVNIIGGGSINDNAIIQTFSLQPQGNFDDYRFEEGITIEVETFEAIGSRNIPVIIESSTKGSPVFIKKTSGTISTEYLILEDIHAIGGATFEANKSQDLGNNDGWTFTAVPEKEFYWVNNGGNWSDLNHWAESSGGTDFHTTLPTQFDDVFFDANSFSTDNQTVEMDTPIYVQSLINLGATNLPKLNAPYASPLNIIKDLDLGDGIDGFIYNTSFIGKAEELSFNQGSTINMQNISFWGDGILALKGPIFTGNLSLFDGTFITDNYDMTLNQFKQGNFNDVIINFGSSKVNCSSNFSFQDPDSEFDPGTSIIMTSGNFEGLGFSFNEVILSGSGIVSGNNEFARLTLTSGSTRSFEAGDIQIVLDELILKGNSVEPINLSSTITDEQAIISVSTGTVEGIYLVLRDIKAEGGAVFNANDSVDDGNNSGWNITAPIPKNYFWVGGQGEWEDFENHWAKNSGSTDFHLSPPSILDNLFFDENSFTAENQEVSIASSEVSFHDMTWDGILFDPSFDSGNTNLNIYGSISISSDMGLNVKFLNFLSTGVESILFSDPTYPGTNSEMKFSGGGTWNIEDSLTTRIFHLDNGTIETQDNGIHVDFATYFTSENIKIFNLGSSVLNTRSLQWASTTGDNLTFNGGESTILCTSSFSPNNQIGGSNNSVILNNLIISNQRPDQALISSNIYLNKLTIDPGKLLKIWPFVEVHFETLHAVGTSDDFIEIYSSQEGDQATLSKSNGTVDAEFLKLKDIKATGGATFNAYSSINDGNVSGWTFFKTDQTIEFGELESISVDSEPITLSAEASSGLSINYSIISGPAEVEGAVLNLTGIPGIVSVKAEQGGDINFNPASAVIQNFCANPVTPSISFVDGTLTSSNEDGNLWFLDGEVVQGATAPTFVPAADGLYAVQVQINECSSEISEQYNFVSSNLIDLEAKSNITISPNPSRSFFRITDLEDGRKNKVKIFDLQGVLIDELEFINEMEVNVSDYMKGLYFLEITFGGLKEKRKLVVW